MTEENREKAYTLGIPWALLKLLDGVTSALAQSYAADMLKGLQDLRCMTTALNIVLIALDASEKEIAASWDIKKGSEPTEER